MQYRYPNKNAVRWGITLRISILPRRREQTAGSARRELRTVKGTVSGRLHLA